MKAVERDGRETAAFPDGRLSPGVGVEWCPTVCGADTAEDTPVRARTDRDCVGVICRMHSFSPARMWIRGLRAYRKPLLHLHTRASEKLPCDTIDTDFMDLNQSAHGDREFGIICARLGVRREVVAGYYRHDDVVGRIRRFADAAPEDRGAPLGTGDREPPARLVLDGVEGDGIAVSMVDTGTRFRLVCAKIRLVRQPETMPSLPVAGVMWRVLPDFRTGTEAWICAGGAHHAAISTAPDVSDIRMPAKFTDTELVVIDENTRPG